MIGVIGVGDIGLPMTGHILGHGFDVIAYDVDPQRLAAAAAKGAQPASDLSELDRAADIVVSCLRTDDQMGAVAGELAAQASPVDCSSRQAPTGWAPCGARRRWWRRPARDSSMRRWSTARWASRRCPQAAPVLAWGDRRRSRGGSRHSRRRAR
ncbi:MAG: 3-hydroxyisobutyrate dehydrogenase [Mycobacterium sp.]|jgi:hypothetical protein|nr:3-hydroxyisobutyrate dehydrogenase [Mycobacterium sp.]